MGTIWRRSGSFEFDANGERAGGAQAFFFQGGTTSALTVYQDADLSIPHDTPVEASGVGRWPAVYIDFIDTFDEQIKDAAGSQLTYYTGIANADPTFSATPDTASPNALQTGDWKFSDVDETKTGFVRANGKTIGNATSGATERAHADCEALFTYRWNKIGNGQAAVSGGRGAGAAADWAANKTIALPDMRGLVPRGLDTMGAASAGEFSGVPFSSGNAASPGSIAGLNTHTLTAGQLPAITPAGTIAYAANFTPAGSVSYAGNFTPAGVNAYAGNFTPAGGISYAGNFTPVGTVSSPSITITDTGHIHAGGDLFDAATSNAIFNATGGITAVTAVNNSGSGNTASATTGITAALASNPIFTGTGTALPAATFTGTSAALPVSNFTGTAAALPAATFTGTAAPLPLALFTGTAFGGGETHNNMGKSMTGTWYIKL